MSLGRKYFLLGDPLPASEIPRMLGRVVEDKIYPRRSFAPIDGEPSHSPEDIIPSLLPEPLVWSSSKDFFSSASHWSLAVELANLFGIDQSVSTQQTIAVESDEVKSYSLPNTLQHFKALMDNDLYARDVRELLKQSKGGHAYFVTGFLTAKGGIFSNYQVRCQEFTVDVTIPVLEAIGSPAAVLAGSGVGDPRIIPSTSKSLYLERSRTIKEEVIFAMTYDVIKGSRSLSLDSNRLLRKSIINAGPKRAKSKHQAFAAGDGSDEDDNSSEDESAAASDDEGELVYVDTELIWDERLDDQDSVVGSFQLQSQHAS